MPKLANVFARPVGTYSPFERFGAALLRFGVVLPVELGVLREGGQRRNVGQARRKTAGFQQQNGVPTVLGQTRRQHGSGRTAAH